MNTSVITLSDIEHTISEMEDRAAISTTPASTHHVSVAWSCPDPSDIWPLLASLSPEKVKVVSRNIIRRSARRIPLTLRYGEKPQLDLRFGKVKGAPAFQALAPLGIESAGIISAVRSGMLSLAPGQKPPLNIDDIPILLRLIQDIHTGNTDDLAAYVESITFQAPLETLDGIEITVNHDPAPDVDVLWHVFPAGQESGLEFAKLQRSAGRKELPILLPILGLPWDSLSENAPEPVGQDDLSRRLKETGAMLEASGLKDPLPVMPMYRNSFIPGETPGGVYAYRCLEHLWRITRTAGFDGSAWKERVIERYNSLITGQMHPSDSILGVLRQHALLSALKNIDIPAFEPIDRKQYAALQAEGETAYGALAKSAAVSREKLAEAAHDAAVRKAIDSAVTTFGKILERIADTSCFAGDSKDLGQIVSALPDLQAAADIPGLKKSVASAETVFETAAHRLREEKTDLDNIRKELDKRHAETSDETTSKMEESLEQVEMFWNDVVPATLRGVQFKLPQKDIDKILRKTISDYKNYLNLTSYDEHEFLKCKTTVWPKSITTCMEKINRLLDDTSELWTVTIEQELGKLEDFRKEKFPKGQPIPDTIAVKQKAHPKPANGLSVTIPKKPGLFGNLLASKEEQDKWHANVIEKLHTEAKNVVNSYQRDILGWLKETTDRFKASLSNITADALKTADAAKTQREDIQSRYLTSLKEATRLEKVLAEGTKTLQAHQKELDSMKKRWLKEKDRILKSIDSIL